MWTSEEEIILGRIYNCQLRKSNELKLSHLAIKSLPKEIYELTNLKRLDISENFIDKIDSDIAKLTALEWLKITGNILPESELTKLEWLLPHVDIVFY